MEVFAGGQLGDERSTIEQVQLGVIDVVRTSTSPVGEFYAPMGVFSMPYIFRDAAHMWKVVQGPIGRELLDGLQQANLVGLAYYDSGSRNFYTTKAAGPIRSVADLKGKRIRTQQSEVVLDMMKALGAEPVPMAFGEVYSALQTGVIDGAENNYPSYHETNHYEVAKYYSTTDHLIIPECLCIAKKSWDAISPAEQKIVRKDAIDAAKLQRKLWAKDSEKAKKEVEAGGAKVNVIKNLKPFQDAMKPVYAEFFKKNPSLKPLVAEIRATK